MQFPDLNQEKDKLVATFSRQHNMPLQDIRVVASPYRISPLGAHIDHQGGPVLGMTINAYSGISRELMTTGYNSRVRECRQAAAELNRLDGKPPAEKLADVSELTFQQHESRLADHLQRRAAHFFSEVGRVQRGLAAWREGRLEDFGRLMAESCRSSIEQYECGIPAIHDLQQIVSSAQGVIGSRFGGGGFGGCVVGLVAAGRAAAAARDIRDAYLKIHPEAASQAAVYLARSADGVRFL